MEQNNKTQIGILLLFLLFGIMYYFNYQDAKKRVDNKNTKAKVEQISSNKETKNTGTTTIAEPKENPVSVTENKQYVLENDKLKVVFNSLGGNIASADIKGYKTFEEKQVSLLKSRENEFGYILKHNENTINTKNLIHNVILQTANKIVLQANIADNAFVQQSYTLKHGELEYTVLFKGVNNNLQGIKNDKIALRWENNTQNMEKSYTQEVNLTTIYTRPFDNKPEYCSCTSNDEKNYTEKIQWISHTQQFFHSTLLSKEGFTDVKNTTHQAVTGDKFMKKLHTEAYLPFAKNSDNVYHFSWIMGANSYKELKAYGNELEDIIPLGWGPMRLVNKFLIIPIFNFLSQYISSFGIIIILLTFFIKTLVWPLTYKTFQSSARMKALTPELNAIKAKYPDDQMKQQQETMKLYTDAGVNPMGGCLPQLVQMPIWLAMYRFFPSSLELRHQPFLWAKDLSTYDDFIKLGTNLPMIGNHISLFCILMTISTLIFSWYNAKTMPPAANDQMKQMQVMQYIFPFFLFFFLNGFSSGLTSYILWNNLISISQTLITNKFLINHDKIAEKIEANKKKPKSTSGFGGKFQQLLSEAQQQQALKNKSDKK